MKTAQCSATCVHGKTDVSNSLFVRLNDCTVHPSV